MNKPNILEIEHHHYGFLAEDNESYDAKSREEVVETTSEKIVAIVYTFEDDIKLIKSVCEMDVKDGDVKKAVARIKGHIKRVDPVENYKVPVKYKYGGNIDR